MAPSLHSRAARSAGLIACVLAATTAGARGADAPALGLPVACQPGRTCFVQHHVDIDPGAGVRDYACGAASYDGHDAVDIRVLSAAAARTGVSVIAAAEGRVLRTRDGMADAFAREVGKRAVTDRECGNAVIIAHAGGLETQYCHLGEGSLAVKPGQTVTRGQTIGRIGYSGLADFAHLHFTVRRYGRVIDPFSGLNGGRDARAASSCQPALTGNSSGASLWTREAYAQLPYRPAEIIQVGFAEALPEWDALERDHQGYAGVSTASPTLLLFARAINVGSSDRLRFRIEGPGGLATDQTAAGPDRHKAIFVTGAGRRRSDNRWPAGQYRGTVDLVREGISIGQMRTVLQLR